MNKKSYTNIGHAKLDIHRKERIGIEEFIYGEGKSIKQLSKIIEYYLSIKKSFLMTRASKEKINYLVKKYPVHFSKIAEMIWIKYPEEKKKTKKITVLTAGSSDYRVALESIITLKYLNYQYTKWIKDCGVANIDRILDQKNILIKSNCLIVIAGMEAALVSVVSGLTGKPVIGVPTSVGYGVNNNGETALKSMLSACTPTISVVNINNGFGAACVADSFLRQ